MFFSELILLPTGFVIIAVLTRSLGTDQYGIYVLALMIISWVESLMNSFLNQSSIVSAIDQDNTQFSSRQILKNYLTAGCILALITAISSNYLSQVFKEPSLKLILIILSIDIPLTAVSKGYQSIWIGTGEFSLRARISALRWISRVILVIIFVGGGFSLKGAIIANVGASFVEAFYAILKKPINPFQNGATSREGSFSVITPIALFVLANRIFANIDLPILRLLNIPLREIGLYGAARNLAVVPGIFSLSVSPLLLSTLRKNISHGVTSSAKALATNAVQASLLLIPFAGIVVGSSNEIVALVLGQDFFEASNYLNILIFAAVFQTIFAITSVTLIATNKNSQLVGIGITFLVTSILGYWITVPRWGAISAAWVIAILSMLAFLTAYLIFHQVWEVKHKSKTALRILLFTLGGYCLSKYWTTQGFVVLLKLSVLSIALLVGILISGEFANQDIKKALNYLRDLLERFPIFKKS